MNKLKVAIFGAGYVGNYLYNTLQRNPDIGEVSLIKRSYLDYTLEENVQDFLFKNNITTVINASGFTGRPNVDACEDEKANTFKMNVALPAMLAGICTNNMLDLHHISSGCIYSGYDVPYTEEHVPDFGLENPTSSWYSKTKHMAEICLKDYLEHVKIYRIRMPFCSEGKDRNYLTKLRNYPNLLDAVNSKTHIPGFCEIVNNIISDSSNFRESFTLNVCNPNPLSTKEIVDIYNKHGKGRADWKFIPYEELPIKAQRSNCVMDTSKLSDMGFKFADEAEAMEQCLSEIVF